MQVLNDILVTMEETAFRLHLVKTIYGAARMSQITHVRNGRGDFNFLNDVSNAGVTPFRDINKMICIAMLFIKIVFRGDLLPGLCIL